MGIRQRIVVKTVIVNGKMLHPRNQRVLYNPVVEGLGSLEATPYPIIITFH